MDFFQHQEAARKKTGRLVLLFALAVIAIVLMVYTAALFTFGFFEARAQLGTGATGNSLLSDSGWFQPKLFMVVSASVLAVVSLGSLYKTSTLRGGGRVVAESLGGRLLEPGSITPQERRLLNVVEEMALASGVPVPPVFVMDHEEGINAFAAGFSPSDAVIGVTRGCMVRLNRDELQGVIAHEFSHVFNGDMRLNIRLIGILHGILVIGLIGQFALRSAHFSSGTSRRRRDGESGGGGIFAILAFGIALAVIGWVGTIFGNMIQAAVSRQREYLADASAVQFTRNPKGISGALKKIGGLPYGARVTSPGAAEVSHMLFGQGMKRGLTSLFATHPPLVERIQRMEPRFSGEFEPIPIDFESPYTPGGAYASIAGTPGVSRKVVEEQRESEEAQRLEVARNATALQLIGQPSEFHVERARALIAGIPQSVVDAAHEPYGARAVLYAMLIGDDATLRTVQLMTLRTKIDEGTLVETERLLADVDAVERAARLPLIDMALPALREMSKDQFADFSAGVEALIRADERLDAFEWVLRRILMRHLSPNFGKRPKLRLVEFYGLQRLTRECSIFLSTLARVGHADDASASEAFAFGASRFPRITPTFLAREECGLADLGRALEKLDRISAPLKRKLLEAGAFTIAHDHEITILEAEIFRGASDSLGCPLPPLLPGQRLA